MQLNKYRKAISVFFAALILITVCVVLPVTASAGYAGEAKEAAISDILPGDGEGGMARNNDGSDRSGTGTDDDILDPDNGTVGNDVDHDDGDGSGTSDGKDDSRDTSDADVTSDKTSDTSGKKDDVTSGKDTTNDLVDDVKDEAENMGVWGVIIAIIIIVIIIALIFAIIPKRKK